MINFGWSIGVVVAGAFMGSVSLPYQTNQASSAPLQVATQYDRFKDKTTLDLNLGELRGADGVSAQCTLKIKVMHDGDADNPKNLPNVIILGFILSSLGSRESGYMEVDFLLDGVALRMLPGPSFGLSNNSISLEFKTEDFSKFIRARTVEGRAFGRIFVLTPSQMEAIRALGSRVSLQVP